MRLLLAPHVKALLNEDQEITRESIDRFGAIAVIDDTVEATLSEVVSQAIEEHRDKVVGASLDVDAPPFTPEAWWLAHVRKCGPAVKLKPFDPGRAVGIDREGRLVLKYPGDLNLDDYLRAVDEGHYPSKEHELAITRSGAFGGNGFFVASVVVWLLQQFPAVLVGAGIDRQMLRLDKRRREAFENLALDWAARKIAYPRELREFVETKLLWYPDVLGQRLAISPDAAARLLATLGYTGMDDGLMEFCDTPDARAIRQVWLDAERAESHVTLDELLDAELES